MEARLLSEMLETELTPNSKTWHSGVESPEIIENPLKSIEIDGNHRESIEIN